ncbi:MAG: hypothetical protein K1X56_01220 [Flavobacteriales bacterium]|nr:hypothetical protein [Flavobacteriales bacterium]
MKRAIVLFFGLLMFSCGSVTWERKTFEGGVSIEVPNYMTVTHELAPDALVQLENQARELYFMIDKRKKSELSDAGVEFNLVAFSKELMKSMTENLKKSSNTDHGEITCGGLKAYRFEVTGKPDIAQSISYQVVIVEGAQDFYIQTAWTTTGARTNWYKEDMKKMMESFRLAI